MTESGESEQPAARPDRGPRPMTEGEIRAYLQKHEWGVLSLLHDGRPYAVPVSFGFDGDHLFIASGPGRKRRALEESPAVCLTVADVVDGDQWSSVVVMADVEPVQSLRGKLHGLNTIRRQQPGATLPSAKDLARATSATVFRLSPVEVSGRRRG